MYDVQQIGITESSPGQVKIGVWVKGDFLFECIRDLNTMYRAGVCIAFPVTRESLIADGFTQV